MTGICISAMVLLLAANPVCAQRQAKAAPPVARPVDIAVTRQKAEAGDIQAQLTLAQHLALNQPKDALKWYQKAAAKQQVEAYYQLGNMWLFGVKAGDEAQSVAPDPVAGVKWTFRAATNLYARACLNMSRIMERGISAKTNLVEAYAWMQIFAEREPVAGRSELTNLTSRLSAATIAEGQKLAKQLKARQWASLSIVQVARMASSLRLEGVTIGGRPLAVINRRTLTIGETAAIPVTGGTLEVKCLEIEEYSVRVHIAGEGEPRLLRFGDSLAAQAGR